MSQSAEAKHLSTDDLWALLDGDLVDFKGAQAHVDRCDDCSHRWHTIRLANSVITEALTFPVDSLRIQTNASTDASKSDPTVPAPIGDKTRASGAVVIHRRTHPRRYWWHGIAVGGAAVALVSGLFVGIGRVAHSAVSHKAIAMISPTVNGATAVDSGTKLAQYADKQENSVMFAANSHASTGTSSSPSLQVFTVKLPDGSPLTGVHVAIVAAGYILASGDTRSDGTLTLRIRAAASQVLNSGGAVVPQLTRATVVCWKTGYQPVVVYGQPLWNGSFDIHTAATMRLLTDASAPAQIIAAGDFRTAPSASVSAQTLLTPKSAAPPTLAQVELLVLWTELQMAKSLSSPTTANTQ